MNWLMVDESVCWFMKGKRVSKFIEKGTAQPRGLRGWLEQSSERGNVPRRSDARTWSLVWRHLEYKALDAKAKSKRVDWRDGQPPCSSALKRTRLTAGWNGWSQRKSSKAAARLLLVLASARQTFKLWLLAKFHIAAPGMLQECFEGQSNRRSPRILIMLLAVRSKVTEGYSLGG